MTRLKRVLHVDDDLDIRTITKLALEVVGDFEILQCSSGVQALEESAEFSPELFLLDYMMPNMDGETTYHNLRKMAGFEEVPVIFMTARAHGDFTEKLKEKGALGIISKPFDPMLLSDRLHDIWNSQD